MNNDRVSVLEQAFSGLQAEQARTREKLDAMLQILMQQQQRPRIATPPPQNPTPTPPTPNVRAPPPALPTEFDGDRTNT